MEKNLEKEVIISRLSLDKLPKEEFKSILMYMDDLIVDREKAKQNVSKYKTEMAFGLTLFSLGLFLTVFSYVELKYEFFIFTGLMLGGLYFIYEGYHKYRHGEEDIRNKGKIKKNKFDPYK